MGQYLTRNNQQQEEEKFEEVPPHLRPIPITFDDLPKAPYETEDTRFIQSFSMDETEEYKRFFDEWGFVVIRDVLTQQEIDNSIEDIWNVCTGKDHASADMFDNRKRYAEADDKQFVPVDRNDPTTWKFDNGWPAMSQVGILGGLVATQESSFVNRQSPNVYRVYSELLERKDLLVSFDRFGAMRPTKNVLLKDGVERKDFPDYQTREVWMHWDMNPWALLLTEEEKVKKRTIQDAPITKVRDSFFITENNQSLVNYKKLQGFVALSDSTEDDGGFLCVPQCHKIVNQWAEANKTIGLDKKFAGTDFVNVPDRDPLFNQGQKITCRAGSLVIWDSRVAHCNYPNNSPNFRFVQYVKMFPREKNLPIYYKTRKLLVQELLQFTGFEPSELGRKLFGLDDWEDWEEQ